MKVLLVEDDDNKRTQISDFLITRFASFDVLIARSVHSALRRLLEGGIDLLLLDMTMPTFDITADETGGRPQAYAGREVLSQMERRSLFTPTLVVTQFDEFGEGDDVLTLNELDDQLRVAYPAIYLGIIHYDVTAGEWKKKLGQRIETLLGRVEDQRR